MSIYVRVKHVKSTFFFHCEPTDKVSTITDRIRSTAGIDSKIDLKLILDAKTELDMNKTLKDAGIKNDDVIYYLKGSNKKFEDFNSVIQAPKMTQVQTQTTQAPTTKKMAEPIDIE
jgi:transcription elongation factor B subunit 2